MICLYVLMLLGLSMTCLSNLTSEHKGISTFLKSCPNLQRLRYGKDVFQFFMHPNLPDKYKALSGSGGFIQHGGSVALEIAGRGNDNFIIYKFCIQTKGVSEVQLFYEGWLPPVDSGSGEGDTYMRAMVPGLGREKITVKNPWKLQTTCVGNRGVNSKFYVQLLKEPIINSVLVMDVKLVACLLDEEDIYFYE